jgi:hypothetical protein
MDACCAGTCQPKFSEGQSCTLFRSCEPGLQCHSVCLSGDIGSSCASARDCDPDAWCDLTARRCKADLPLGASCTSILQCGGDASCIGLSIVDSRPGQCLRSSRVGDPCGSTCFGNLSCVAGRCQKLPALGEACSALTPCTGVDAACIEGRCALRGEPGDSCSSSENCQSGLFCTSELGDALAVCARAGGMDASCVESRHCQSYRCSGGGQAVGRCLSWSEACPVGETF